jgi:hypothetical protein
VVFNRAKLDFGYRGTPIIIELAFDVVKGVASMHDRMGSK